MIASFVWVIFGDLVNLHMKLIYKLDINANKSLYVKSFNKHKDNENYSFVKTLKKNSSNGFIDNNSEINILLPTTEFVYHKELISLYSVISHLNIALRAPPTYL
jgi:hypothetical protein